VTLGELLAVLATGEPTHVAPWGFCDPHSYRGYYEQLAFEPCEDVTVGEMQHAAQNAVGAVYEGYKGGMFTMTLDTDVWIAPYGREGEMIGPTLLKYMLADYPNQGAK